MVKITSRMEDKSSIRDVSCVHLLDVSPNMGGNVLGA